MATEDEKTEHNPEWENRILCPDGNCIGVIGLDGRCKECGISYGSPAEGVSTTAETPDTPVTSGGNQDQESGPDWENRKLCPDGNCIGVIGPDGRCKECGREG